MGNVTYFFGAGGSVECIPSVLKMKDLYDRNSLIGANFWKGYYRLFDYWYSDGIKTTLQIKQLKLFEKLELDLEWLFNKFNEYYSIDTYARLLYLTNKDLELEKLKNILTIYFHIQQKIIPPDKRYDNFWATILERDKIPHNIKVVSWNYDLQFEISFYDFDLKKRNFTRLKEDKFTIQKTLTDTKAANEKSFLHKINGTASFKKVKSHNDNELLTDYLMRDVETSKFNKILLKILETFYNEKEYFFDSEMLFSWERNNIEELMFNSWKISLSETEYLVVVGYSFPTFNRFIDKMFLTEIFQKVKKIYIQSPIDSINNIKNRLLTLANSSGIKRFNETNIFLIEDVGQFYYPPELD